MSWPGQGAKSKGFGPPFYHFTSFVRYKLPVNSQVMNFVIEDEKFMHFNEIITNNEYMLT